MVSALLINTFISFMEFIRCPISGSDQTEDVFSVPDRFEPESGYSWQIQRSKESGLVFLNPRPDKQEIVKYYENEAYDPFVSASSSRSLFQNSYEALRRFISLRSKATKVLAQAKLPERGVYNVLEIGCATGEFLVELQNAAEPSILKCWGVEPSEKAVQFAKETYDLNVLQGELLSVEIPKPMDLILMWHSLEHIHNINDTLQKIHRILKEDGLLCVAMPNLQSLDAQHYCEHWVAYDAPRHLYHFSPITFGKLLKQHGFEIVDMESLPIDSFYNTILSEQLKAKLQEKSISPLTLLKALWIGFEAAVDGFNPSKASSVLYFIRKKSP